MGIELRELKAGDKKTLKAFVNVVDDIYRDAPAYVRPLDFDITERLDHKKNPFFAHAEGTAWVAYKDGRPVGRITAQIDQGHLARHKDGAGMFGFFDTIDDPEVAKALLNEAEAWLKVRGMKVARGPFSLSINEETGCLVEGFDISPTVGMTYHNPYQSGLIEQAGYGKCKDFYAWGYDIGDVPVRAQKAFDQVAAMPEVTVRCCNPKDFDNEVKLMMDIFNDAWSDNWGYVPVTEAEMLKAAKDSKLFLIPELTKLAFIDGEPAAVIFALPDLYELIRDLRGQLFPLGILKLLWRLRVRGPKQARLILLGIRKKWRHVRRYAGLSAHLYVEINRSAHLLGFKKGELGWTLEDNAAVNAGIRAMGGRREKTYRVYEKTL